MIQHPILVNRPIVCSPQGVKLCRPSEVVLDLLESWPKGPYYKEDGEQILNIDGTRTSPVPLFKVQSDEHTYFFRKCSTKYPASPRSAW